MGPNMGGAVPEELLDSDTVVLSALSTVGTAEEILYKIPICFQDISELQKKKILNPVQCDIYTRREL